MSTSRKHSACSTTTPASFTTTLRTTWLEGTTYAATAALLTLVAVIATLVPARRATMVDPLIALRSA